MSTFDSQIDDITFALRVFAGVKDEAGVISPVLTEAGRFAAQVLAPLDPIGQREGCALLEGGRVRTPTGWQEAYQKFAESGWNTVHFAPEIGGQGLPAPVSVAVAELFQTANVAFCLALMPFAGVVELLERFGTPEQKQRYLPQLVSGRWSATLAMTESQAGTDIGACRTTATEAPQGVRVRGQKCFITYGEHDLNENILHFVLARDPAGRSGVKGLSLYVVPKRAVQEDGSLGPINDVCCIAVEKKIGLHGSPTTVLSFGGSGEGAWGERLGEPCKGLEHMFVVLNRARLNIGVFGLASAERAWQAARVYSNERIQGTDAQGAPCVIARHPDVRRMLLEMKSSVAATRALAYYTAGVLDRSRNDVDAAARVRWRKRLDLLTPIVKGWVTEIAFGVASTGVQVAGGVGYIDESEAARCFTEARVHPIYEGTTGIQALDLALRKVAKDQAQVAGELLLEITESWPRMLAGATLEDLQVETEACVAALGAANKWIVAKAESTPAEVQAVAIHYLHMWGTVLGAWLLSRAAQEDANRVLDARAFMLHQLPMVATHWRIMERAAAVFAGPDPQVR